MPIVFRQTRIWCVPAPPGCAVHSWATPECIHAHACPNWHRPAKNRDEGSVNVGYNIYTYICIRICKIVVHSRCMHACMHVYVCTWAVAETIGCAARTLTFAAGIYVCLLLHRWCVGVSIYICTYLCRSAPVCVLITPTPLPQTHAHTYRHT